MIALIIIGSIIGYILIGAGVAIITQCINKDYFITDADTDLDVVDLTMWPLLAIAWLIEGIRLAFVGIGRLVNHCVAKLLPRSKRPENPPCESSRPPPPPPYPPPQRRLPELVAGWSAQAVLERRPFEFPELDHDPPEPLREPSSNEVQAMIRAGISADEYYQSERNNIVIIDSDTGRTQIIANPWTLTGRIIKESDPEKDTTLVEPEETETEPELYDIIL
jgi:hypothetical protein